MKTGKLVAYNHTDYDSYKAAVYCTAVYTIGAGEMEMNVNHISEVIAVAENAFSAAGCRGDFTYLFLIDGDIFLPLMPANWWRCVRNEGATS